MCFKFTLNAIKIFRVYFHNLLFCVHRHKHVLSSLFLIGFLCHFLQFLFLMSFVSHELVFYFCFVVCHSILCSSILIMNNFYTFNLSIFYHYILQFLYIHCIISAIFDKYISVFITV